MMSPLGNLPETEGATLAAAPVRARRVSFGTSNLAERTSVIDDIVVEIRAKIVSGEFKDGDTLPSQDEMARVLGVSRASLREALNRLVLMGLVEIRHGRGTFVRTARPQDLMNSLSSLLILDKPSAAELLQARFHVESALSALAALNATEEDLERMRVLIERMERESSTINVDLFVPWDAQIHMAFAQAANNPVLLKVLEIIWDVLPPRIRHITSVEQIPSFISFHRAIYEAIARRDPVAARKQMERHVEHLIHLNDHTEGVAAPSS